MKPGLSTRDFCEDISGFGSPDERFRSAILLLDVPFYRADQIRGAMENPAPQLSLGQVPEEPLDHIEPRGTGGREVHVKSRVLGKPRLYFRMLVGSIVIGDQMKLPVFGCSSINLSHLAHRNRWFATRQHRIAFNLQQSLLNETCPPACHRSPSSTHFDTNLLTRLVLPCKQGHRGTLGQSHRYPPAHSPSLQLLVLSFGQFSFRCNSHDAV